MVAAHVFRHHIAGNRARCAAQDDDGHQLLVAEAYPRRNGQENRRQQHQLDQCCRAGGAQLFERLCAFKPSADAEEGKRRGAAREQIHPLGNHGREIHGQQRKRKPRQNAQNDRVGDNAAQRAPDQPFPVPPPSCRSGDRQYEHRKDVIQRHARYDHQRHQPGIPVQALHERHAQDRL